LKGLPLGLLTERNSDNEKVLLAIISALVLTGCATSSQSGSEYSADDINFAEMMIPHHEGAIVMAQDVAVSMNKEVADLSAAIISAQELEIAAMKELLLKGNFSHANFYLRNFLTLGSLNTTV